MLAVSMKKSQLGGLLNRRLGSIGILGHDNAYDEVRADCIGSIFASPDGGNSFAGQKHPKNTSIH